MAGPTFAFVYRAPPTRAELEASARRVARRHRWDGQVRTVAVLAILTVGTAHAEPDKFASVGVALGGAIHDVHPSGLLLGGEASAGLLLDKQRIWLGAYTDLIRDFGSDATRLSIGPELGREYFGIDGGLVHQFADDTWGFTIRPVVTNAVFTGFVRYTQLSGSAESHHFEIGLLLKLPYVPGLSFR